MNKKTMAILIVVLAGLLVWAVGSSGSGSLAQGGGEVGPQAVLTPLLQYQGRLTDPGTGEAVADGVYSISFRLYNVESGGSWLWMETEDVSVQGGLFSTVLGDTTALDHSLFNGQALWLGVRVGADAEATPRQQVLPVAYALSLVPGAVVEASSSSPVLQVNNTGSGDALNVGGDLNVSGSLTGGSHNHSAANINSGTLSTSRFSAYDDLVAEGKIGSASNQVAPGYYVPLLRYRSWSETINVNSTRQYFTNDKLTVTPPANGYILIMAKTRYNCPADEPTQSYFGVYVTTSTATPTSATSFSYSSVVGYAFPLEGSSSSYGDFNPNVVVYPYYVTGGTTYRIWLGVDGANIGASCQAVSPRIIATFHLSGM